MLFKKNLIWLTVLEFIELAIGKVGRWLFGLASNLAKFSDGAIIISSLLLSSLLVIAPGQKEEPTVRPYFI